MGLAGPPTLVGRPTQSIFIFGYLQIQDKARPNSTDLYFGFLQIQDIAGQSAPPNQAIMASIALLLHLIIATSNIAGAVKVSPPPLHQEGNQTEAEPSFRSLSWFPAASFTDPCNATEPPANAVIGPPDDMVCEGAEPGERICVCVTNIGPAGSGYHRHCGTCHDPCALHFHMEEPDEDFVAFVS